MNHFLKVKLLDKTAQIPQRGSALAAGYDLFANSEAKIAPGEKALIKTGIAISIPQSHYARIAPRSGLAHKHFIDVMAGVVDEDYRGEVGVILVNLSAEQPFQVNKGDRVAQMILEKITYAEVKVVDQLEDTLRGEGGYGSTGLQATLPLQQDHLASLLQQGLLSEQEASLYRQRIQQITKQGEAVATFLKAPEASLELLRQIGKE